MSSIQIRGSRLQRSMRILIWMWMWIGTKLSSGGGGGWRAPNIRAAVNQVEAAAYELASFIVADVHSGTFDEC